MPNKNALINKVVIVSGGSREIGIAILLTFIARGGKS